MYAIQNVKWSKVLFFGMKCYEINSKYLWQFMVVQDSNTFRHDRIIFTHSNLSPITHSILSPITNKSCVYIL